MSNEDYTKELEKFVIFLCDVYTKGQDSLACQTDNQGETDEKWLSIYMSFPTIQGTFNRQYVRRIGNLRTQLLNREAPGVTLKELFERLADGRTERNPS